MTENPNVPSRSNPGEIQAFLKRLAQTPAPRVAAGKSRLIFALDATASREPTWEQAREIQVDMFDAVSSLGGLEIQLCYYRGLSDFAATAWFSEPKPLRQHMLQVRCLGGYTQIGRVLAHALAETRSRKVEALVFVGDCLEEDVDALCRLAGELSLHGVKAFLFQEGYDRTAEMAFRQISTLTQGAFCRFDGTSPSQLRELLRAVAVYAAGGLGALEDFSRNRDPSVRQLTSQLRSR